MAEQPRSWLKRSGPKGTSIYEGNQDIDPRFGPTGGTTTPDDGVGLPPRSWYVSDWTDRMNDRMDARRQAVLDQRWDDQERMLGDGGYVSGQPTPFLVEPWGERRTRAVPGFQNGGQIEVGGRGGPDSQLIQFWASPGEVVTVTPEDEAYFARTRLGLLDSPRYEMQELPYSNAFPEQGRTRMKAGLPMYDNGTQFPVRSGGQPTYGQLVEYFANQKYLEYMNDLLQNDKWLVEQSGMFGPPNPGALTLQGMQEARQQRQALGRVLGGDRAAGGRGQGVGYNTAVLSLDPSQASMIQGGYEMELDPFTKRAIDAGQRDPGTFRFGSPEWEYYHWRRANLQNINAYGQPTGRPRTYGDVMAQPSQQEQPLNLAAPGRSEIKTATAPQTEPPRGAWWENRRFWGSQPSEAMEPERSITDEGEVSKRRTPWMRKGAPRLGARVSA